MHRTREFSRIRFARWTRRCQAHWNWNSELLELCEGQRGDARARVLCNWHSLLCLASKRYKSCLSAYSVMILRRCHSCCSCCYCSCCCWWLRIIGSHACQENASDPQPSRRRLPALPLYPTKCSCLCRAYKGERIRFFIKTVSFSIFFFRLPRLVSICFPILFKLLSYCSATAAKTFVIYFTSLVNNIQHRSE